MPTYEYACRDCGEHLEVVQSFRDGPLTTCGNCGGGLRKVFSAAGIIFKGSGYYVTDTRNRVSSEASTSSEDSKRAKGSTDKTEATGKGDGGATSDGGGSAPAAESA